jgi:hypothetical protein
MNGILGWYLRKILNKEKIEKQVSDIYEKAEKTDKSRYFCNGVFLNTKYMKEHHALTREDYVELLKAYKGKILAITGQADVQADYKVLKNLELIDRVTIYAPEQVNHVLRDIDGESNIMNIKKEYNLSLKKSISPKIKNSINDWINKL